MEYGWNFWPKKDGEKWARKNIFEIPSIVRKAIFGPTDFS